MVEWEDVAAWAEAVFRGLKQMEALQVDLPPTGPLVLNLADHVGLNAIAIANAGLTREFAGSFAAYIQLVGFNFAWDN